MPIPQNALEGGNAFQGQIRNANLAEVESRELLRTEANCAFFLVHYPENWECVSEGLEGPTWLPVLQRDWLMPGVNMKRTRRRDEPVEAMYDQSHLKITRDGGVILPQTLQVAGYDGYLRSIPCKHPRNGLEGTFYLDAWEVPVVRPGKKVKFNRDQAGYNRWRLALVEEGYIDAANPAIITEKLERAQEHMERHRGKVELTSEAREAIVSVAVAKLERLSAAKLPQREAGDGPRNKDARSNTARGAKAAKRK